MKAGFIGLGHMGAGMAASLLRAGHTVTVYNRTPGKAQALVERGAHTAAQVADACRGEAVITMLADDAALESVVYGDEGVIGGLDKGEFLKAFQPDFYFDDQRTHVASASQHVATGHVPFGIANKRKVTP